MSLAVAVPAAVAAAAAFGTASAVQHAAAHAQTGGGHVDVTGLGRLLADRRWLLGILADTVGLGLQILALDNGPVSVVQPLQVLGLLIALPVGTMLGGPRPTRRAAAHAALLVTALAAFLLLVGNPGRGRPPGRGTGVSLSLSLGLLAGTGLLLLASRRRSAVTRAVVHGITSGALFALTAVLLRVLALRFHHYGAHLFTHPAGLVPLGCLLAAGIAGIGVAQGGFQVGPLAASLPAQTAADPLVAVVLGASTLGEHIPLTAFRVLGYAAALVVITISARALAQAEHPEQTPSPRLPASSLGGRYRT